MKKIKKHNTLTDGYIPVTLNNAVLPDKLINALYWKFEENGANGERFKVMHLKVVDKKVRV